jgi:hypothetical protein
VQHVEFRLQRLLSGAVQCALVARDVGRLGQHLRGECEPGLVDLGTQPAERPEQRQMALTALAQLARRPHVVDAHEHLPGLDDRALAHQELGHDAALQVLHHLDLARRDHLAITPGDLLQLSPARPGEECDEEGRDHEQEQMGEAAWGVKVGAGAAEHQVGVGAAGPPGAATRGRCGGARHVRSAPGPRRRRGP